MPVDMPENSHNAVIAAAESSAKPLEKKKETRDQKIGREIAFGIQQTIACWVTDFIDPPVSKWFQNRFGDKTKTVTDKHVWGGELIGDSIAVFIYLAIKRGAGRTVDKVIGTVERNFDGMLTRMAPKKKPGDSAEQAAQNLADYKHFQAENIVDSTIIALSSTGANIATQRALGNEQKMIVILGSKIIGAIATMSVMLGIRSALPNQMQKFDDSLSKNVFSPVVRGVQKIAGVAPERTESPQASEVAETTAQSAPLVANPSARTSDTAQESQWANRMANAQQAPNIAPTLH